jgi:ABC-type multidrug transport system permease subunit
MDVSTPTTDRMMAGFCSMVFAVPAAAFWWLFLSTLHLAFIVQNSYAYRTRPVWTAAIFFLLTASVCGAVSFTFFKMARKRFQEK